MDNNELNLEELMAINGGQNEAAEYLSALAVERGAVLADGSADLALLPRVMNRDDLARLYEIRNKLAPLRRPIRRPGPRC